MRNQSQVRNYIRTILYDNRLKRYTEGLHSLFVGENNAMNAFRRGDILQVKKHIDFGKEFSNIKNLRAYYERNREVILRDGPANRSLTQEELEEILDEFLEIANEQMNLMKCFDQMNMDYLETPFGKDCLSILDAASGEEENLTDEQICCGFYMLAQLICAVIPFLKCFIDLHRSRLQLAQQKLLEAGCDCRISGPRPGGALCNYMCNFLRQERKKLKELEDDYEEGQKNCKKMLSEFEEGGQYANCLEFMNRNRSSNLRNRIMSLNPTNNTTRNSPSSSPSSSPSTPSTPPPSSPPSGGGGGGYGY